MSAPLKLPLPHTAGTAHVPAVATPVSGVRLLFVDHVRVLLTILVVIHHLAVTYGVMAPWYYLEPPNDTTAQLLLIVLVLFNQGFFMGCFFLIAGYFTPGAYDRKGPRAFVGDRLLRLGVPLLVFWVLLAPLTTLIGWSSLVPFMPPQHGPPLPLWRQYLAMMGPGPLWFLEALLIFALAYTVWRRYAGRPASQPDLNSPPPSYGMIVGFVVFLAVATFVLRLWVPIGALLPILGFPTPAHLPQYIGLFCAGLLAYRRNWFATIPDSMGRAGLVTALAATLVLFPLAFLLGSAPDTGAVLWTGGAHWQAFVYALWEAILCVGMSIGLLTLFRRRYNGQSRLWQFLSTHAYTVYIIHATVIVAVAYALSGIQLPVLLKFGVAVLLALPLCFASAYVVRKLPGARRIL